MIQDIKPYRFHNEFQKAEPILENHFFSFRGHEVLLLSRKDGQLCLPAFRDLQQSLSNVKDLIVYLFSVDDIPLYLIKCRVGLALDGGMLKYFPVQMLEHIQPTWTYFAAVTALHLDCWYKQNSFCGKCGREMSQSTEQRALICSSCGNIVYPQISPVVIVAVVNGDKLLLTKYSDHSVSQWVLISGFVEIGETIEDAVHREVYEEAGIRIKNLEYFGSQPWGVSNSVIMGYIAELDGSDEIHVDHNELSDAAWHPRSELPRELSDISLTYELIEALRISKKGGNA